MVLGTVIDWTVYRALDLTLGTALWVVSKTGHGIYNVGCYVTGYGSTTDQKPEELELNLLKEQNQLLKEQNELLRKRIIPKIQESPF